MLLLVRYIHETGHTVQTHHSRRQPSQENWPSPSPSGPSPPSPSDDTTLGTSRCPRVLRPVPAIAGLSKTHRSSPGTSPGSVPLLPERVSNLPPETPCSPPARCWAFKDATEVLLFQHFTRCLSSFVRFMRVIKSVSQSMADFSLVRPLRSRPPLRHPNPSPSPPLPSTNGCNFSPLRPSQEPRWQ
jgi:hypothetical protein